MIISSNLKSFYILRLQSVSKSADNTSPSASAPKPASSEGIPSSVIDTYTNKVCCGPIFMISHNSNWKRKQDTERLLIDYLFVESSW